MKKTVISLIILLVVAEASLAAELLKPWADTWTSAAYYQTNFERKDFNGPLARFEGRLGITLLPMWGETTLNPYVVYWGAASSDNNHYNNYIAAGGGVRFYPFAHLETGNLLKEIKVFAESLNIDYLKDKQNALYWPPGAATPEAKPGQDVRYGMDLWYEWNQSQADGSIRANRGYPWFEMFLNMSLRSTNFYQPDFNSYLLQLQPKIGIYTSGSDEVPGIEPYLLGELTKSGKSDFWLNNMQYGLGVRLHPFRNDNTKGIIRNLFYKLKIYFEARYVSYLGEKPTDGRPANDFRLGIDFTSGR
jgi:hypothetical protein